MYRVAARPTSAAEVAGHAGRVVEAEGIGPAGGIDLVEDTGREVGIGLAEDTDLKEGIELEDIDPEVDTEPEARIDLADID